MAKQKITMTLEQDLVQKIDKDRGLIPRSAYIEKLLKDHLASTQNPRTRYGPDQTPPGQTTPPHTEPIRANPSHADPDQTGPTQTKR